MRRALGIALVALPAAAPAAAARTRIAVEIPRIATTRDVVKVRGHVSRRARLMLQRRTAAGWRAVGPRVTARRGFSLRWRAPARPGVVVLRVAAAAGGGA